MNGVDPTITDAIVETQQATLSNPDIVTASASGKAYLAVAQSAALAIQDAVDALRHNGAIATSASGIALAQFLASGDSRYLDALSAAQAMMTKAIEDFAKVGEAAVATLNAFPSH
jgi:hypothetical protein